MFHLQHKSEQWLQTQLPLLQLRVKLFPLDKKHQDLPIRRLSMTPSCLATTLPTIAQGKNLRAEQQVGWS